MTPERWNRIATIFDAALVIEPQKRRAYLADACAGDEALRLEVERLLAEDERTSGFLNRPLVGPDALREPPNGSDSTIQDTAGKLILRRFAVRTKLGTGGMGEVYLADDTKLKRLVALKRLPARMRMDERFRKRLLHEARRASSINDSHIAQVYDILEEGDETFLVMEYIEGTTLRQKIGSPLPAGEFLDIAMQCAGALVAAHQKGVVHCDIKPENIMITPTGQVKILDFGIAKRLPFYDAEVATDSVELQGLVGTPAYMAPEVLAGHPPDARADIYSLGVTFYEALTGQRPTPASFSMPAAPAPEGAKGEATSPALELSVKRMLQLDPAQRYATAADLLQDLRALRDSGLVLAATPARAGRLSQRVRLALAGAMAAVIVAAVAMTLLWPSINRALHPVPEEKQVAVLPFQAAGVDAETKAFADGLNEVLSAKLTQLTQRPQFQVIPAREIRARKVVTPEDARKEFGVNLVITGTWQQAAGTVHVVPVLIDAAQNRQLRADEFVAAASDPIGVEEEVAAGVLHMLEIELQPAEQQSFKVGGTVEPDAYAHYLRGRGYLEEFQKPENIDSAIAEFDRALQRNPAYAPALAGLGEAYWRKYEATNDREWSLLAKNDCQRAANLAESEPPGHACLGQVLLGTGEYQQAAQQYQRALELEPTNDDAVQGLATAFAKLGNTQQAEVTYRKAIALRPKYWLSYNSLGAFYFAHGRYPEAAETFAKVVSIAPDSFRGWSNLGGTYVMQGRFAEAIPTLVHSISIRPTEAAYSNLATAYFELHRFDEAAASYTEALRRNQQNYVIWGNLGTSYYFAGDRQRANSAYERAIALAKSSLDVNPKSPEVYGNVATYYSALEEKEPALDALNHALRLTQTDPYVLFDAALVFRDLSDFSQAFGYLEKALQHDFSCPIVLNAPAFDNMRQDSRFKSIVDRYCGSDKRT